MQEKNGKTFFTYQRRLSLGRPSHSAVWCTALIHHIDVVRGGMVREVNSRVLGKGLELLSANGGKFEINQLLFF